MSRRSLLPLAMVLLLASACGVPERVETRIELTLLGLDPSASDLRFTLVRGSLVLFVSSSVERKIVEPDTRRIVFENVAIDPNFYVEVDVLTGTQIIQHGRVAGVTQEAKVAVWTVTLAPATQPLPICDKLDNNGNGKVDELNCSG